jgi:Aldolase/RraA
VRQSFLDGPATPYGEMVEILAGRNIAHRIGRADQPRSVGVQELDPADEDVAEAPLEQKPVPTNLIRNHAVDLNVPIGCGDVPVYPGDIVVGDEDGVVFVPRDIAEEVANEAFEQTVLEDFVQEQVEAGRGIFGLYPPDPATREEFRRWRTENGR